MAFTHTFIGVVLCHILIVSKMRSASRTTQEHKTLESKKSVQIIRDALTRNDVDLVHGLATLEGPHMVRVEAVHGHRLLTAEHILLAVGTRPSHPQSVEPDGQTIITSDDILTLPQL